MKMEELSGDLLDERFKFSVNASSFDLMRLAAATTFEGAFPLMNCGA